MTVIPMLSTSDAHAAIPGPDAALALLRHHLRSALKLADDLDLQLVGIDICQALERLDGN